MNRPDYWLTKFSKLRVDRARGDPAPHKPLLLLVLCDLAEQGAVPHGALPLSPELAFRFYTYWKIVAGRRTQRPDVRLPFHFLSGDGIWSVTDERGEPSPDKKLTKLARPPSDLVAFLEDPANREKARHLLIAKYFRPSEQIALYEMIGFPVPSRQEIERAAAYKSPEEARLAGREARFRIRVLPAYLYNCALTQYRMIALNGKTALDAAHIHQLTQGGSNHPTNGIALSKTAHWLFDQGFWSISNDYTILVAEDRFDERGDAAHLLKSRAGKMILRPQNQHYLPDSESLTWHRQRHGFD